MADLDVLDIRDLLEEQEDLEDLWEQEDREKEWADSPLTIVHQPQERASA